MAPIGPAVAPTSMAVAPLALPARWGPGPLEWRDTVSSTQDRIRELALAGAPEGTVVVADHQSAGRGQRGRRWQAERGRSLLFSCLLRPGGDAALWPRITVAAGVAVAEAVAALAGVAAELEWPNDVVVGHRKLAGILAEGSSDGATGQVALGVGINVTQGDGDWPPDLAGRAVSLAQLETGERRAAVSRPALLATVLECLADRYGQLRSGEFAAVREAWLARARLGQVVETPDGPGRAVGLGPGGELIVQGADGRQRALLSRGPA